MIVRSQQKCFGGTQGFYEHESSIGAMRFSMFMPPEKEPPVLYFLAGLSCTEETFVIKAGAQRVAAQLGLALVTCDTSPRASRFSGDDENWDFGLGAGFYVDATQAPWSAAYRMYTYVVEDLPHVIESEFPVAKRRGIFGHSMGGHGALMIALRNPERYSSVSAFAPIVAPSQVPWGQKAFSRYLGEAGWADYDTVELLKTKKFPGTLYVDQGTADKFLDRELRPQLLEAACAQAGQPLSLQRRDGYDHSYYFIASFVEDHLRHHAALLK